MKINTMSNEIIATKFSRAMDNFLDGDAIIELNDYSFTMTSENYRIYVEIEKFDDEVDIGIDRFMFDTNYEEHHTETVHSLNDGFTYLKTLVA